MGGLFSPVQGLTGVYEVIGSAFVSIDQVFKILDADEQVEDAPDTIDAPRFLGSVSNENVSFRYQPDERLVLQNVSLHARPGEMIALVGESGAGKRTLVALLQRLYDPSEGAIRIDGHDVRRFTQASLRRQIAMVLQEAILFNDTVRNNIAYGRPSAIQGEIETAARAANADAFIRQLPQGYDTTIGECGSVL